MATKKKDPAAVALGRKGGAKKVPKGLSMKTPEERAEIARMGAAKKWANARKAAAKKKK